MIDILLATYNGDKYLDELIESIRLQSFENWRIIVNDDGSTDNTLYILSKWKLVLGSKLIIIDNRSKRLGPSKNFDYLLYNSTAEYVMLCDQDDVWLADKIIKSFDLLKELENNYGISTPLMVCCDLEVVDENLKLISPSFWRMRKDDPELIYDFEKLIAHSIVTGNTILLNRAGVNVSIPIKTNFFLHDQWISIMVAYYGKIAFLPESLIKYRQHTSNVLGAFNLNVRYLLMKIKFIPYYIYSWYMLKQVLNIKFSLIRVLYFKVVYNTKKLFK